MKKPKVAIIMGSKSNLPIVEKAGSILKDFGVEYEIIVSSAHRQPGRTRAIAQGLKRKGVDVVIVAAGKAAHLPGVIASWVSIPVIGLPIGTAPLNGIDSLLSIAQMPKGIPVACVGISEPENAALLAIQILGMKYPANAKKFKEHKRKLAGK
ncbi:5-(carboxyamino)imidazole ribonucleotide mutase [Candidatus Desantisbacteria bacterium CG1_02_38_46]|uniref:N5-carboxyaminoimidazole ribonucleotide mutase n=3 Tax=unclassified Candidatus Desantisiibacteriota TaxID=3106372 RepID=A0A2H9PCR8_9BACT|nr:MAG: 5-(carboxyamino)imidazole ribonucleotide mutase [Candidatus Desantisbacteria bacterium CG1_02_38_46]PIU51475.1 MAG: 5-(carboxyamino)imidazole ribonucleotide mutase [Candidatus Desantisbacteria bacterium CG07_land_8_20_14_0_80_39_15]PIZ17059.1 MAG: 5-(carboxyamino)imidazole ribonucleotide mutase [Candidatus Desantisbacteria bacterium CG_4_10_14_0_8_um_filter_39_17]